MLKHSAMLTVTLLGSLLPVPSFADTPTNLPRMYFADTVSGRPFSKDPAVVKFKGKYWLYYSVPPYEGKPTEGWSIGVATSQNLVDWTKAGELRNTGEAEAQGFTAPGAIVLRGSVHLFYQTYGNGERDAICHAWSEDGLHFTRNPTNPVFHPTGDWNVGRAIDADVIPHGDRLLMYWATRDPNMKIQMQGVAAAPLDSDFSRNKWTQLNTNGPILAPTVATDLDAQGLDLAWEKRCVEAAAMARHDGRLYMFYAGGYNNDPQQIGVAVSDDGVRFRRLSDKPFLPNGMLGSWNSSESGHPYLFQDEDGQDYLFYQGNNTNGKTWYLSVVPIDWRDGRPILAPEKLSQR
ncbi:MAG: family 43 glycosylhydrolase [Pirellulaceae bacterium]